MFAQTSANGVAKKTPTLDEYKKFAVTHDGNVANGARLFADDQKLGCVKCHSTDGSASKAGPDLQAAGDKYGRWDLVDAILKPSAVIAPGYGTVIVETKSGTEYQGILKQSNANGIQLMGADGKLISVAASDIKQQRGSSVSLMPENLHQNLTLQEFTDVIEYVVSFHQPESTLTSNKGMPSLIPEIAKPIEAKPLFNEQLRLPRGKAQTGLTSMHQIPGYPNRFLVLHQKGVIFLMEKDGTNETKTVFADLTGEVFSDRGPNGLLGLTFHPQFKKNRKYYVKYQVFEDGVVTTIIVEKIFATDFKTDSVTSPRRLLKILSVAEDHSGGCMQFGPDGYLYFAMGDTGPHNDPNGHAQNLNLLLGKMMRIDVDHKDPGKEYAVPKDNPLVGRADVRTEIWAWGLREPWRFSFDSATGDLWLSDVGQDRVEEVDIIRRGENYGWNVYEGYEPFSNQYRKPDAKYVYPVFAYRRKYGNSITGGYVYRGDKESSFYGVYLCGDYTSKRIFGVTQENRTLKAVRQIGTIPQGLVSFATDEAGNIYAVGYEGMIYKLDFSQSRYDQLKTE